MRVFVCEYVTGGGLIGRGLPPLLRAEGDLMLAALINDLTAVPGTQVLSTRDSRLGPLDVDARFVVPRRAEAVWPFWRRCMAEADAVWPIAPETGGVLERLSAMTGDEGRVLLNSRPPAVRTAASKRATAEVLARHGVPVVPTVPARASVPASAAGWVAKPDDGVGAEDTRLFRDASDMRDWLAAEGRRDRFVVQPFLEGEAASMSVLCRDGLASVLACNRQHVVLRDGCFRYLGSDVGALEDLRPALVPIAAGVAAAIPELFGHIGIDLVITPRGPVVLEVNPRLTTSYAGLKVALGQNPAALVLALLGDGAPAAATPLGRATVDVGGRQG